MSHWLADLGRSAIFRVSLINAVLLALALGGSFAGAWLVARNGMEVEARERISIEVNALARELAEEGLPGVTAAIASRFRRPGSLHYLVVADGKAVIGDLTGVPRAPGWHRFPVVLPADGHRGEQEHDMLARTVRAADGTLIAVGEDMTTSEAMRNMLLRAMLPVGAIALVLAVLLSIGATRQALRRMDDVMSVVRAVQGGDLAARVELRNPSRDDVDALAAAINAMLDRLGSLMTTVSSVSAEIAHDLRTPLTHVRHALDTARWTDDEGERRQSVETATDGIVQTLRLFESMLRLAELDSGQVRADFAPVDVCTIAERALDAYRADIEAAGRTIRWSCHLRFVVSGNEDLLTQAIANLIDNALKHTQVGAVIALRIRGTESKVWIAVEDDGPGVPEAGIETMLRPFGRLDKARRTPGSGLGLAIAKAIAELHGGRIEVENLKPGLRVRIELPRDKASVLAGLPSCAAPAGCGS